MALEKPGNLEFFLLLCGHPEATIPAGTVDVCRILTQNNLKAIGRNYYKPEDAVRIPNHGYDVLIVDHGIRILALGH